MARRFGRKPSLREMQERSLASQRYYALMAPPEKREIAAAEIARMEAEQPAPKRERKPSGLPTEADVLRAISEALAIHPSVAVAIRMNSGAASYEASSGNYAPVWFHKWIKRLKPELMLMPDIIGWTVDAKPFAIEVKRPGFKAPRNDRERGQEHYLVFIRSIGGRAGFATSVTEALRIITE